MKTFVWSHSTTVAVALVGCLYWSLAAIAAEEQTGPQGGTVTGILTAKAETWIEVRADGEKESKRYIPFWHGGMPKDGGGLDKDMLQTIRKLIVPNRVRLDWKQEEHRRIVNVEMAVPAEKAGTVQGTVTAKEKNGIEVKPDDGGPAEQYWPRWIGGVPKDGGGFDKDMIRTLEGIKIGDKVKLNWKYDERKRVVEITRLAN